MSLVMPITVNGYGIGELNITRLEPLTEGRDLYTYRWSVNVQGRGDLPKISRMGGGIKHYYSDGPLKLIRKVLDIATLQEES